MNLNTKLIDVKGVGAKTGELLAAGELITVRDLIEFLPRKFEDFSRVQKIADLTPGKVTVRVRAESVSTRFVRRGMRVTTAVFTDDSGKIRATWFNQTYREKQLAGGGEWFVSGEFGFNGRQYQLTSPSVESVKDLPVQTGRLLPIYSMRRGLKPAVTRKILNELRPLITMLPETLPTEIVTLEKLMSRADALLNTHFPTTTDSADAAHSRLAFEELFSLILAAKLNKQANSRLNGFRIPFDQIAIKGFVDSLPFTMTAAQKRALWEILQDFDGSAKSQLIDARLSKNVKIVSEETRNDELDERRDNDVATNIPPMNRLLQGDVGSGKTVVAGAAAFQIGLAGFQTAFLAPTEILATQHAETLMKLLAPFGVNVTLLTGSVKGKGRTETLKQIESGVAHVIVGTHALLQPTIKFHKLGFVVIDEQHRFGVKQRHELLSKSHDDFMPHLLSMTATPIPRSLQLTLFGDLDVSILNKLPKGRKPIKTEIVSPNSRAQMNQKIAEELQNSRQIYFIAPLIEESEKSERESVEKLAKKIAIEFKKYRIGVLHGRQPTEYKEKTMREFANHDVDILVATTVVEVGVDVPNATVIVIENADRFGLAQLHQLRGRVGRSEHQSFCFLIQSDSKPPTRRLREVERSNDGFYLAEVDLKLRGAGEIYGTAQHGQLNLQIANLADTKMIKCAAAAAEWFIESDQNLLEYKELAMEVNKYQKLTTLN